MQNRTGGEITVMAILFALIFLVLIFKCVGLVLRICGKLLGAVISLVGFVLSLAVGAVLFGLSTAFASVLFLVGIVWLVIRILL